MNDVKFASDVDDNMPSAIRTTVDQVVGVLEDISKQWFSNNQIKANPEKCHLICSTEEQISLSIENNVLQNSKYRQCRQAHFKSHINDICKKGWQKLNDFSRIAPYMDFI